LREFQNSRANQTPRGGKRNGGKLHSPGQPGNRGDTPL